MPDTSDGPIELLVKTIEKQTVFSWFTDLIVCLVKFLVVLGGDRTIACWEALLWAALEGEQLLDLLGFVSDEIS